MDANANASSNLTGHFCAPVPPLLALLSNSYADAHKYLSIIVCGIGATTNLVNIAVFSQPSMRNPTNTLLTALALSDCLMSTMYLPFCLYFTMRSRLKLDCPEPLPWQLFLWVQVCLTIFTHAWSSWLTVALAGFRLVYIELPVRSKQLCTGRTARLAIGLAALLAVVMVVPNALGHDVVPTKPDRVAERRNACLLEPNATTYYTFGMKFTEESILSGLIFWIMGIGIKLLPALLLTLFSVFLIKSLKRTNERRRTLRSGGNHHAPTAAGHGSPNEDKQTNRTTKLLITIVLVSVVSMTPQAIIFFLMGSSSNKNCFSLRFYDPMGDVFDLMTLINHSINFLFYYGMSEQFRQALTGLVGGLCRRNRQRATLARNAHSASTCGAGGRAAGAAPGELQPINDVAETDF